MSYYEEEDLARFGDVGKHSPELFEKFMAWYQACQEEGAQEGRGHRGQVFAARALQAPPADDSRVCERDRRDHLRQLQQHAGVLTESAQHESCASQRTEQGADAAGGEECQGGRGRGLQSGSSAHGPKHDENAEVVSRIIRQQRKTHCGAVLCAHQHHARRALLHTASALLTTATTTTQPICKRTRPGHESAIYYARPPPLSHSTQH